MEKKQLVDEVTSRIGCRELGDWFTQLTTALGLAKEALIPIPARETHTLALPQWGMAFVMQHPHAGDVVEGDPDRWVMSDVTFTSTWNGPWPFGLDGATATPASAQTQLGNDTSGLSPRDVAKGDLRQTFFLADGRAVGITWWSGLVGIESMHLTRLGLPMAYKDQLPLQLA